MGGCGDCDEAAFKGPPDREAGSPEDVHPGPDFGAEPGRAVLHSRTGEASRSPTRWEPPAISVKSPVPPDTGIAHPFTAVPLALWGTW